MVWTIKDFKRDKREEDSNVKYWFYEKKGDILISLVSPPNPEVRISGGNFDSFRIPMGDSIYQKISAEEVLSVAVKNLNRRAN